MEKNQEFTVSIEDMSEDGAGIGKLDGYIWFIKDAVIGDVVRARAMKMKKNYGFARLMEILTPSAARVEPRCPVARQCGGCQLQAMSYEEQLKFKERKVKNHLLRIGKFREDEIHMLPIMGMEEPWRYRNKAQFPFGMDKNGNIVAGFYAGRTHNIIECGDCLLGVEENKDILDVIKGFMRDHNIRPYDETAHKGLVRHALIRKGFHSGELMVCLVINGKDIPAKDLVEKYDAVCIAIGAEVPRDLPIEGRDMKGIYFALELLGQQNRVLEGIIPQSEDLISAKGKKVLVIGGGDTGSDCVGTCNRHGAAKITQIEIMPKPPVHDNPQTPWPMYPMVLKTSSSHEEGCERRWLLNAIRFIGEKNRLKAVEVEEVTWKRDENGRMQMLPTGKKEVIDADLVFLAMGFVHPALEGIVSELGLTVDARKNIAVDSLQKSNVDKVFACGDATTGASLVVKAMAAGKKTAEAIDRYLK